MRLSRQSAFLVLVGTCAAAGLTPAACVASSAAPPGGEDASIPLLEDSAAPAEDGSAPQDATVADASSHDGSSPIDSAQPTTDSATDAGPDAPAQPGWVWIGGHDVGGSAGSYGTLGSASPSNSPPAREGSASLVSGSGAFWLFGGYTFASGDGGADDYYFYNDLWSYDPGAGEWTWIAGGDTTNIATSFPPTMDAGASASYFPGGRAWPAAWTDASGNLWVFGGTANYNTDDAFDDLWKFDGHYWTWMGGSGALNAAGTYPASAGTSGPSYYPPGRSGAATWIDSAGNLWLFGGDNASGYFDDLWSYDIAQGVWTWQGGKSGTGKSDGAYGDGGAFGANNLPGGRVTASFGQAANGNFWLFGGDGYDSAGTQNHLNDLWQYSASAPGWEWVAGDDLVSQEGQFPASTGTGGAAFTPGARDTACAWVDGSGNFWVFGGWGLGGTSSTYGYLNDLWMFDGTSWTWEAGKNTTNVAGVYGTMGIPAASSSPGSRWATAGCWYSGGKLWMFGGGGYDSTGTGEVVLDDLWVFQPPGAGADAGDGG